MLKDVNLYKFKQQDIVDDMFLTVIEKVIDADLIHDRVLILLLKNSEC